MKFNLNEVLLFKFVFNSTVTTSAMRRSVRPFMKVVNEAIKSAEPKYKEAAKVLEEKFKDSENNEETSKKMLMEMGSATLKVNEEIFVEFDFTRNSTKNFFISFWTPFQWNPEMHGKSIIERVEELDEKVCEIYPEIDVNIDKELEKKESGE